MTFHPRRLRLSLAQTTLALGLITTLSLGCSDDDSNNKSNTNKTTKTNTSGTSTGTSTATATSTSTGTATGTSTATATATSTSTGTTATGLLIEGLSDKVEVRFDEKKVLHLRCKTNEDCFAAQGYYHAAHRFSQMDVRRRSGRGEVATFLKMKNDGALNIDVAMRRIMTTRQGEPLEEALYKGLDPETKTAVDAYTRGVNAWLDDQKAGRNGAVLSKEYNDSNINKESIRPWEPEDSVAVGLVLLNSLMNRSADKITAARRMVQLGFKEDGSEDEEGMKLFQDLYLGWHIDPDSPILTASGESYTKLGDARISPKALDLRQAAQGFRGKENVFAQASMFWEDVTKLQGKGPFGSNSWATSPSKSAGDFAILGHDPHLQLSNPALWYVAELDAQTDGTGDLHAAGVSFPGMPGVQLGFSEDVSWSATVAYWDLMDVYTETLSDDGEGVMLNGTKVPFIKKTYEFKNADATETREFLFVPHHGPVISIDKENKTAVSLKSVLPDQTDDLALFINLGRSKDLAQAKSVLAKSTAVGFNFTLIDRKGNIAYYPFAAIPRREWDVTKQPAWLPLPGTGEYEWGEKYIRADELPQMDNPKTGFIVTANAAITDDMIDGIAGNEGYPPLQSNFMAMGSRQGRVLDVIEAKDDHTWESHLALQGDNVSWVAQQILPKILESVNEQALNFNTPGTLDALKDWKYDCPTGLKGSNPKTAEKADGLAASESIGCAAFHVLMFTLASTVIDDATKARGLDVTQSYEIRILYNLFMSPEKLNYPETSYWDNESTSNKIETKSEAVTAALNQTATNLNALFGTSKVDDWRWGRVHTLDLRADLFSSITDTYNNGAYAAPGGAFTVNVANSRNPGTGKGDYGFSAGASMRMVVEGKADGFVGRFQLPGGQVHQRDSEFYEHLLPDWLENKPFIMPFKASEVEAAAKENYVISPK